MQGTIADRKAQREKWRAENPHEHTPVAPGFQKYRVVKPLPVYLEWGVEVGGALIFPGPDNEEGWKDMAELTTPQARVFVKALISDGIIAPEEEED